MIAVTTGGSRRGPIVAECLLLIAMLAACSRSPTDSLGGEPPSATRCATRANDTESKLVECIQQDALWAHMTALQNIADENPGPGGHPSRNSGEPGYLESVNYVAAMMRNAGYRVTIQQYPFLYRAFASPPVFGEVSPAARDFAPGHDWSTPLSVAGGDVTAQVQAAGGILIPAPATPASASGCSAGDFAGFVSGRIALIQRGTCAYAQKVANAVAAGASGAIIFNEGNPDRTLATPCRAFDPGVPLVCLASYDVGKALYDQVQAGPTTAHISTSFVSDSARADYNLIAESPYGDSNHVVVVDAHLDAIYGAGMLDNASGSSAILEIALKLANTRTRRQLRYIWFGGEELGLLGSFYYTRHLSPVEAARIAFDVDVDVAATPNYVYAIADPANSAWVNQFPANVVPGSEVGNDDFAGYFTKAGLPYEYRSNDGTDSYAFSLIGVPNTGILTGQDCCKSAADVARFGGFPGNYEGHVPGTDGGFVDRPFLWGDNLDNNDPVVLETAARAVASVVFHLANDNWGASHSPDR